MDRYKKIEDLFEGFGHIEGVTEGDRKFFDYVAPDSMHSGITKLGYGTRLELPCTDVTDSPLSVLFTLGRGFNEYRYYVRLTACMPDWRKYTNNLKIEVNGRVIYDYDTTLFENVCVGWPVTFYPCPAEALREGENTVTVSTTNRSGGGSYVARLSLLTLPAIKDGMQISSLRYARINSPFTVAIKGEKDVKVIKCDNLKITEIKKSGLENGTTLIKCVAESKDVKLEILYGGEKKTLLCPVIADGSDDAFLVGADNDDCRQDYSEEATRIPEIFALTGMGNFFQFRPSINRNMAEFPDRETWIKRTKWLYDFNIKLSIADGNNQLGFLPGVDPEMFEGKHFHETYLYFSRVIRDLPWGKERFFIDTDKIDRAQTFGECKALYLEALDKMCQRQFKDGLNASIGSPSLLVAYEAAKFNRVTMEPVSGVNLLLGATRGASKGKWGVHIPISWYYGYYNDINKARKYRNTMFYAYLNGADYVYAENGLFKSQCMSREDWDTGFSILNRKYTREMYDYSVTHPRKGKLEVPFACVYGNNEFILWQKDSRMAELKDGKNWDLYAWGKWEDKNVYACWRAIDAWLPVAENQNTVDDEFNLSLHSGTRFGSVDVIPYEKDFSAYKLITFLGWNTYEDGLAERLYKYVNNGVVALISYCHFNKTDNSYGKFEYENGEKVQKLLGLKAVGLVDCKDDIIIDGEVYKNGGGIKILSAKVSETVEGRPEPVVCDASGKVILYRRKIGKGMLYFCTFAEYYGKAQFVAVMKRILEEISYPLCSSYCDNKNIAYTERTLDSGDRLFSFMNMSSANEQKQSFRITVKDGGKEIKKSFDIGLCEIKEFVFKKV